MQWVAPPVRALALMTLAFSVAACDRTLALPSSIADGIDGAGLHLEPAWFEGVPISREAAIGAAQDAVVDGSFEGRVTSVELVTVTGPGNPRLGWEPADHPLVYAIQWAAASTVGLVLVSARTGEVLLVTAYEGSAARGSSVEVA